MRFKHLSVIAILVAICSFSVDCLAKKPTGYKRKDWVGYLTVDIVPASDLDIYKTPRKSRLIIDGIIRELCIDDIVPPFKKHCHDYGSGLVKKGSKDGYMALNADIMKLVDSLPIPADSLQLSYYVNGCQVLFEDEIKQLRKLTERDIVRKEIVYNEERKIISAFIETSRAKK